jgi:hypothetical protein
MIWTRTEALVMSQNSCVFCYGLGLREGRAEHTTVCNCVLRKIFQACYARFRYCALKEPYVSRVSLEANLGARPATYGLRNEEYMADFCGIAKRTLEGDDLALAIFKFHFLLGANWVLCCRKLHIERGMFYHQVYRIQQQVGRAFRETEPYALFPLDEYFGSTTERAVAPPSAVDEPARRKYSAA